MNLDRLDDFVTAVEQIEIELRGIRHALEALLEIATEDAAIVDEQ